MLYAAQQNAGLPSGAEFVSGFLQELTIDNDLTGIAECETHFDLIKKEIELGLADLDEGSTDLTLQGYL